MQPFDMQDLDTVVMRARHQLVAGARHKSPASGLYASPMGGEERAAEAARWVGEADPELADEWHLPKRLSGVRRYPLVVGYPRSGPAHAQADEEGTAEALDRALQAARGIGESFAQDWHDSMLSPAVFVSLDTGADGEPLFVFTLLVELEEDFDVDNYPEVEVERLRSDLRARVPRTPVDDWRCLLTTGTKAGAARR